MTCLTRLTSISIGTTIVGDAGDVNRASAAMIRPANALAGMPIVTATLLLAEMGSERARAPSTTNSPRGTTSTSSFMTRANASGTGTGIT